MVDDEQLVASGLRSPAAVRAAPAPVPDDPVLEQVQQVDPVELGIRAALSAKQGGHSDDSAVSIGMWAAAALRQTQRAGQITVHRVETQAEFSVHSPHVGSSATLDLSRGSGQHFHIRKKGSPDSGGGGERGYLDRRMAAIRHVTFASGCGFTAIGNEDTLQLLEGLGVQLYASTWHGLLANDAPSPVTVSEEVTLQICSPDGRSIDVTTSIYLIKGKASGLLLGTPVLTAMNTSLVFDADAPYLESREPVPSPKGNIRFPVLTQRNASVAHLAAERSRTSV